MCVNFFIFKITNFSFVLYDLRSQRIQIRRFCFLPCFSIDAVVAIVVVVVVVYIIFPLCFLSFYSSFLPLLLLFNFFFRCVCTFPPELLYKDTTF